jgi:hypothetical protein
MRLVLLAVLVCIAWPAHAQSERLSKAERIARVTGVEELLVAAQRTGNEAVKQQAAAVLSQLRQAGAPDALVAMLAPLTDEMMRRINESWDPKVAAKIYADGLADALSDPELQEAERYYSSDEGHKTFTVITTSQRKMQEYIAARTTAALQKETAEFFRQLKQAIDQSRRQ